MVDHAYPTIFNIVSRNITGLKRLKTVFHQASYVYCCCEFQCASAVASKHIPVPLWHPVPTGNQDKPFFRCTIWQTREFVQKVAPVLKLSFLALKLAASVYGIPIPDLSSLFPAELSSILGVDVGSLANDAFSSLIEDCGMDLSTVLQDTFGDQLIADMKDNGVSPALMRPSRFSDDVLQALQSLFPATVCGFISS
jgi:hypothetical protein